MKFDAEHERMLNAVLDWLEPRGFYVHRASILADFRAGKALPTYIQGAQGHNTLAAFDIPVVVSEHMPEDHAAIVVTEKQPDGTVVVKDAAIVKGFRRV